MARVWFVTRLARILSSAGCWILSRQSHRRHSASSLGRDPANPATRPHPVRTLRRSAGSPAANRRCDLVHVDSDEDHLLAAIPDFGMPLLVDLMTDDIDIGPMRLGSQPTKTRQNRAEPRRPACDQTPILSKRLASQKNPLLRSTPFQS